jgi:Uma2 family endonuclease
MKTLEQTIHYNPDLTQIINGEEVMSPSPKELHQFVASELVFLLTSYVKTHRLGRVYFAPFDVIFEEDFDRLQPDILFVSNENRKILQDWVCGVPDLVIEIVSPGSRKMDTVIKKDIYQRYGVPECWIVFPKKVCIEVYTLVDGKYALYGSFSDEEMVRSGMFDDLSFSVKSVMS